jgi:hypothetical protein
MKKTIMMAALLLLVITGKAQVKIGVMGGWNYCSAKAVYSGVKQSTGFVNGFGAGITTDIPFDGVLHFVPAAMINKPGLYYKPIIRHHHKRKIFHHLPRSHTRIKCRI